MTNVLNIGQKLFKTIGPSYKFIILEFEVIKIEKNKKDRCIDYTIKCTNCPEHDIHGRCKKCCSMLVDKPEIDDSCEVIIREESGRTFDFVSMSDGDFDITGGSLETKTDDKYKYYYRTKYYTTMFGAVSDILYQRIDRLKPELESHERALQRLNDSGSHGEDVDLKRIRIGEIIESLKDQIREARETMKSYEFK